MTDHIIKFISLRYIYIYIYIYIYNVCYQLCNRVLTLIECSI